MVYSILEYIDVHIKELNETFYNFFIMFNFFNVIQPSFRHYTFIQRALYCRTASEIIVNLVFFLFFGMHPNRLVVPWTKQRTSFEHIILLAYVTRVVTCLRSFTHQRIKPGQAVLGKIKPGCSRQILEFLNCFHIPTKFKNKTWSVVIDLNELGHQVAST